MELIDANAHGNVHGGVIMRMVDEAAAIVAIKHSQNPTVVTARVERFDFLAPAFTPMRSCRCPASPPTSRNSTATAWSTRRTA